MTRVRCNRQRRMAMQIRLAIVAVGLLGVTLYRYSTGPSEQATAGAASSGTRSLFSEDDPTSSYPSFGFSRAELSDGAVIVHIIGILYMFIALAIIVDEYFVPALELIAEALDMSADVAGATLMAAGGSAPELFTSFIGVFISKDDVGFGTIVGSAVFNVLMVIGVCAVSTPGTLDLTWWPLFRDSIYYMASLTVLALFFNSGADGKEYVIEWWEALILLLMYVLYVAMMKKNEVLKRWILPRVQPKKYNTDGSLIRGDVEMQPKRQQSDASLYRGARRFHAGVFRIMTTGLDFFSQATTHIVRKIQGDVRQTFEQIASTRRRSADQPKASEVSISKKDLSDVLRMVDPRCTPKDIEAMMNDMDTNRDGKVTFEEFAAWYAASEARVRADLHAAFDFIDANHDGVVNLEELRTLFERLGDKLSTNDVKTVFSLLDKDHDGSVSREEFENWYETSEYFDHHHHEGIGASVSESANTPFELRPPGTTRGNIVFYLTFPITGLLYLTLKDKGNDNAKTATYTFFGSIIWIAAFSYLMVWWATVAGDVAGIGPKEMGLTFLAAGTSIPDLLSSVVVAKQGEGDMAVSSSIGSNIFDVLVGLPLPWFFYTVFEGEGVEVKADTLLLSIVLLFGMIGVTVGTIALSQWKMTHRMGYTMFVLYVVFVAQDLLRSYNVF